MDPHTHFDDLARRKLEELHVPFEEGHWEAAQQLLQERRRRGLFGRWSLLALLLLFGGGIAWWAMRHTPGTSTTEPATHALTPAATGSNPALHAPEATAADARSNGRAASDQTPGALAHASAAPAATDNPVATALPVKHPASNTGANRNAPHHSNVHRTHPEKGTIPAALGMATVQPGESIAAPFLAPAERVTSEPVEPKAEAADRPPTPASSAALAVEAAFVQEVEQEPQWKELEPPAPSHSVVAVPDEVAPRTAEAEPATLPDAAEEDASAPVLDPVLDGTAPAARSWEFGVLAGPARSNSIYAGGSSAAWQEGLSPERTAWYGVEAMHMGRNLGWGVGLHYGSYRERLAVPELSTTTTEVDRFWFLTPVDTNILVIADTVVVNGQTYFAGQTMPATINVLTSGTDTTITTTLRRVARQSSNRVSYLEVPLLLDAHLVQGRWNLGVRGGPTVGLLSGRRGSLPNSTNDGYIDLGEEAFREMVFGWTARAYVRYRFNAGWSVGVEPMLRGQFGNTLQRDDLTRRSSAIGGVVSLSYRLK